METVEITLCTECEKCPVMTVDVGAEQVTFKEGKEQFRLTKVFQASLVNLIEAGKLGKM